MTTHWTGPLVSENGFKVGNQTTSYDLTDNVANKSTSTITVGTEASTVINVAVQFNDAKGDALTEPWAGNIYFSDDAAGQTLATTAIDTVAVGTDGTVIKEVTAGKHYYVVSEADGDLDLNLTQNAADTLYMQVVMPDGRLKASAVITWAGP